MKTKDKLVKCLHCGSEMCYAIPMNEVNWAYSCAGCGFTANDLMRESDFDVESFEETLPELYKDLKWVDEEERLWYPLVVNTEDGVVFIDGTDKNNWGWAGVKNRDLYDDEKEYYKNEGKEAPSYKSDSSTLKHFGKNGFLQAQYYINGDG